MKQYYKNMKLQTKLIVAFSLVIIILGGQGIGFIMSLSTINNEVDTVVSKIQPALVTARNSANLATQANSSLKFYLESKDGSQKKAYEDNVNQLSKQVELIRDSQLINKLDNSKNNIHQLVEGLGQLVSYSDEMNKLSTNESDKLNTTNYATDYLNPIVKEIAQLLNEAINSEVDEDVDSEQAKSNLARFNEMRYTWSNIVNDMRLFLAFGSPAAKENILVYVEKMDILIKEINQHEDSLSFEQSNAIEELTVKLASYKQNFSKLLIMFDGTKWQADKNFVNTKVTPVIESMNKIMSVIKDQLEAKSKNASATVNTMYNTQSNIIFVGSIFVFIMICILCYVLVRNITRPIAKAVKFANNISEGDLSGHIQSDSTDETGQLLLSLERMKSSLKKQIESEHLLLAKGNELKQALNSATVNVMILDINNNISFISNSLNRLFSTNQVVFANHIPDFDAENIIGSEICTIVKDNGLKQKLSNLKNDYTNVYKLGGLTLKLKFTPIINSDNEHVGTVIEWYDRTSEVTIENEIQTIVDASLKGDLSQRITLTDKSGFFARLSKGVNEMVKVSEHIIKDTATVLGHMSHGDLSKTIQGDYQGSFGQLQNDVNGTIKKLTTVMSEINNNANTVLTGAHEIFEGNTNLLKRTEEQSSSLEETAASMEEMTSTVQQNANNAQQANELALGASKIAGKGGDVVNDAVDAMGEITTSSKKISDIIGVIDDIAFQTNLLALNAAVEAARAGEQGRGFAVVATEVRNLAGRSAIAAKEIKELISESVTKVKEGSKLVDKSGQTLEEIVTAVNEVAKIISEIASAGEEQAIGIEQVNNSISQMDHITQQNAGLVEEAAVASESMGEQARNLNELVGFFIVDENQSTHQTERRSSSRPWNANNADKMKSDKDNASSTSLDFSSARINHLNWKKHLRSFLDNEDIDVKNLEISHMDCALGKWLHSTGKNDYEHISDMGALINVHANLHDISAKVVQLKLDGDDTAAEEEFKRIDAISENIVTLLNNIEATINAEANTTATLKSTGTDDWDQF